MRDPDRLRLALPFPGTYYSKPHRNYFKLGGAFYWAGYPEQALAYLEEVIRRDPSNDKTLSVIGRESPLGLIKKVSDHEETLLDRMLADLEASGFIYEQLASKDVTYAFKHALTQEVAYNSVLVERRKNLHERIGCAMEALFVDRLEDHVSHLAHHYRYSGNTQKALKYLRRAGLQAAQRSTNAEAIENFTAALQLLKAAPKSRERTEQELALQLALGPPLSAARGGVGQARQL